MTYIWLIAMVVLLVIEAAVPGLVSIWFALGALAAMLVSSFGAAVWLQTVVFALVTTVTLVFTRPLIKKMVNAKTQPTNADSVIGKECIVTERVDNVLATGAAKAEGKEWTARSADGAVIEPGVRAEILEIQGVKLIIKPLTAEKKE